MHIPLLKRLTITTCNIVFPPLAVGLLTGFASRETFLNSVLFLLAIIPSHIHGFYIAIVYFTRKRRVRNGRYPGRPHKPGIYSEKVLTGGVGWEDAERLKTGRGRKVDESGRSSRRTSRRRSRSARSGQRVSRVDTRTSGMQQSPLLPTSTRDVRWSDV